MVAIFSMRMDKCHHRPRNAADPSVINVAKRPTPSGSRAATMPAKVASSSNSSAGITRPSALCTSSELILLMSKLIGPSPVNSNFNAG